MQLAEGIGDAEHVPSELRVWTNPRWFVDPWYESRGLVGFQAEINDSGLSSWTTYVFDMLQSRGLVVVN